MGVAQPKRDRVDTERNVVTIMISFTNEQKAAILAEARRRAQGPEPEPAQPSPSPPEQSEPLTYEEIDRQFADIDRLLRDHTAKREADTVDRLAALVREMLEQEREAERAYLMQIIEGVVCGVKQQILAEVTSAEAISGALAGLKEQMLFELHSVLIKDVVAETVRAVRADMATERAIDDDGNVTRFKKVVQ
jgi:hypothetical protein